MTYSADFRSQVIKSVEEQDMSIRQAFAFYDISKATLQNWLKDPSIKLTDISNQTSLIGKDNTVQQHTRNHHYQYDAMGRLTQHKLAGSNTSIIEQFAFDLAGNLVSTHSSRVEDTNKQAQTATRKPQGRPTELTSQGKRVSYTYDSDGRVVHKTIAANALQSSNSLIGFQKELTFKYNANNELSQTVLTHHKGSDTILTTTDYYYDAFGRRIHKHSQISQGSSTQDKHMHMLWDGDNAIQEHTDTHVYNTIYDQGSFSPVARLVWRKDTLQQAANDNSITNDSIVNEQDSSSIQVYHYHNDQLGTPNELTNSQGEVIWLADYEAWGALHKEMCWGHILASQDESYTRVEGKEVWHDQNLNPLQIEKEHLQPIRFQGQHFDIETGLHYNRFRYYDADMGMFTTRDPIGLMGGDNVFAYAPNPTGWVDPLGLSAGAATGGLGKAATTVLKVGRGLPGLLLQAIKPTTMGDGTFYPPEASAEESVSTRTGAKAKADDSPCTSGDCERDKNDCKKRLSDWQIKDRGLDPHDLKHGILGKKAQVSLYRLCKCKDNSIVIRHKNCKGPIIPTWEYY